jgi:translation initiation factor 2B subunit (eIF-2B alpha/beta/delta family)/8-oxo-dGTP pyrophosphatase MutT (NUDIX family)
MQLRHVVTCFVRRPDDGTVLLGRRSDRVSTYPGRWAAVSGSVDEANPTEQAYREIREETGLLREQVELRAGGRPVRFPDWELDIAWVVHPYLFICRDPEQVRRDWEHVRFQWTRPERIPELTTVPMLTEAYGAAVAAEGQPGLDELFREISDDREHGAEELGLWTLEALRTAAVAAGGDRDAFREACRQALSLRPSMAPVRSAALEAWAAASGASLDPERLDTDVATEHIDGLIRAREQGPLQAAGAAAALLPENAAVVTLSYSSTVLFTLREAAGKLGSAVVAESRPACEGRRTAELVASWDVPTELMTDAAGAGEVENADAVLFGADAVSGEGAVVNKTGSLALCCVAAHFGVPTICVATGSKILPSGMQPQIEEMPPDELGEPIEGVTRRNPYFEAVPPSLVGKLIGPGGPFGEEAVRGRAERLRELETELTGTA